MEVNHCKFEHKFQSAELAADTVINRTELEIRIT
jgi:hypothetical protein